MPKFKFSAKNITLAALFLALALILPFLTGQIKQIGNALCPMHLPVLLCGFFCGPVTAMIVGFIAPLLRLLLFGMPPLMPTGAAMCFELAAYGLVSGALYRKLPKTKKNIYVSLISAMISGRIVWGCAMIVISKLSDTAFSWKIFAAGAFVNAVPGMIIQIILVPLLVSTLKKQTDGRY